MPEESLVQDIQNQHINLFTLQRLKERWHCSMQAIIMRLEQLGLIDSDKKTYLFKQLSFKKWIRNEPLDDKIPFEHPKLFNLFIESLLVEIKVLKLSDFENILQCYKEEIPDLISINASLVENTISNNVLHLELKDLV